MKLILDQEANESDYMWVDQFMYEDKIKNLYWTVQSKSFYYNGAQFDYEQKYAMRISDMTTVSPEVFDLILSNHQNMCGVMSVQKTLLIKCEKDFKANFSLSILFQDLSVEFDLGKLIVCVKACYINIYKQSIVPLNMQLDFNIKHIKS